MPYWREARGGPPSDHRRGGSVRLALERWNPAGAQGLPSVAPRTRLLDGMGELVRDQPTARFRSGFVSSRPEHDMVTDGVSEGIDLPGRPVSPRIVVHLHG